MTYQPPPSGGPPPPPPGYGPPGGGRSSFDPKTVNPLDWGILACGVLAFIFSMFDYYKYSASAGGFSASATFSAWHGFFGWFAALLALIAAALIAVELFMPQTKLPVAARMAAFLLFAVASLCVIIAIFVVPGNTAGVGVHINKGHGFAFWIDLILILAGTVLSLMRAQQTGTQLPGRLNELPNIGARGPQGGLGGATPPAPGYAPPPPSGYAPPPAPGYAPPPPSSYAPPPPAPSGQPPMPGTGAPPPHPPEQQPPQGFGQPPQ